jgi:ATP-dependent Lhr-like helicase
MEDKVLEIAFQYFKDKGWIPFDFQVQTWKDYLEGKSGLLNAPTGSGKTFALWFPVILEYIRNNPNDWQKTKKKWHAIDLGHSFEGFGTGYSKSHAGSL